MIKIIRVMLIPNNRQRSKLFQYANTARFAYNWALGREQTNYDSKSVGANTHRTSYHNSGAGEEVRRQSVHNHTYRKQYGRPATIYFGGYCAGIARHYHGFVHRKTLVDKVIGICQGVIYHITC